MRDKYDFTAIESKWQHIWEEENAFATNEDESKEKYYVLEMFPYPSGKLHMGHVRNYSIGDVIARFKKMKGFNVLHPMGWDSFGLPAENAAIKNGIHPFTWTNSNMNDMRDQLKSLGLSYDWNREVATCKPDYYRWMQWIFIQFYKKGLAYKKDNPVNWCPDCNTVLANEQVVDGCCERCHTPVTKKHLSQWYLKITDYADRLLENLDDLPGWPDKVKSMQRNWIGRSEGAEVTFTIDGSGKDLVVYTTRPDTLFGVTYMVLAPEHPYVRELTAGTEYEAAVNAYVDACAHKSELERTSLSKEKLNSLNKPLIIRIPDGFREFIRIDKSVSFINENDAVLHFRKLPAPGSAFQYIAGLITAQLNRTVFSIIYEFLYHLYQGCLPCGAVSAKNSQISPEFKIIPDPFVLNNNSVNSLHDPPPHT